MFLTLLEFWQGCLAQDYIVSLEWKQDGWELSKMHAVFLLKPAQVFHLIESRLKQLLLQLRSHSREAGIMGSAYALSPDPRSSSYTERRLHMSRSFEQILSITFTYMVTVEEPSPMLFRLFSIQLWLTRRTGDRSSALLERSVTL